MAYHQKFCTTFGRNSACRKIQVQVDKTTIPPNAELPPNFDGDSDTFGQDADDITSTLIHTSPRILPLSILQTKRIEVINISPDSDDKRTRNDGHTEAELKKLPADQLINIILENSPKWTN